MSHRYEFTGDVIEGVLQLPEEILARLRSKGISRVRVVLTSVADDETQLAMRGIDSQTIDLVAGIQRFNRDVATIVLSGEGAAADGPLANRLLRLAAESQRKQP